MQLTVRYTAVLFLTALISLFGSVSIAFAEDASAEIEGSAEVQLGMPPPGGPGKPRPLQILHDQRKDLKEKAKGELKTLKQEGREMWKDAKTEWKTASSGPERREALKEERKEMKANMKERLQVLFRTHLGNAVNRMNAAIQHFENFTERIESRIEKLKERGIVTTSIEAKLDLAVDAVAKADADVSAFASIASSTPDESTAEEVKSEIRAALNKAKDSIRAAHRALIATVQELTAVVRANAGTRAEINSTTTVDAENDDVE
ncbi:hypothetical protein C4585_03230 [Candidatus Parcubacteria bacterium]|nr:MAG: hypothetical protein C4585_03230 [Candidatus Parcubacteria bacterium]